MAKKRKKHGSRRRHRRVGAFNLGGKGVGVGLIAVGAGFLLGNAVNGAIDKLLPKTTDATPVPTKSGQTIAMVGQLGVGGLLLMSKKTGTTGMVMKGVGGLLAGAGLKRSLKVLGVISGYQNVPVIGRHRMAGYQSAPVLGATTPAQLAGKTPPQLAGYRPAGSGVGGYVPAGSGVLGGIGSCDDNGSGITYNSGSGYMN